MRLTKVDGSLQVLIEVVDPKHAQDSFDSHGELPFLRGIAKKLVHAHTKFLDFPQSEAARWHL